MKKQLVIAAGLAVLSTSAYATKSRMQALGQDAGIGSFYLDDTRNIFHNAAHLNGMKDYVVTEWGARQNVADGDITPKAEGGFFKSGGSFSYGVYLGRMAAHDTARTATAGNDYATLATINGGTVGDAAFLDTGNNFDLFIAGDMGLEWGVHLSYATDKDEGGIAAAGGSALAYEKKQSSMGVDLGVLMGDLEVFANLDLSDKSEGASATNDKWEADLGINAGATYSMSGMTFFANYQKSGYEYTAAGTKTSEGSKSLIAVGAAKVHELSGGRWFYEARYRISKSEMTDSPNGDKAEINVNNLPLTIGFEADATSWLTLRGSIVQNLMGSVEAKHDGTTGSGKKFKVGNTGDVNAGATLNFGKLKVDGVIGTDHGLGDSTTAANSDTGFLSLDNLMTRVAVHYWF